MNSIPARELPDDIAPQRRDDTVHAVRVVQGEPDELLCGRADIPACAPEWTGDDVDCMWCVSILA